jgi:hypothetical protein
LEHRHLLPDEIALLVDGEEGFGIAPLRAHLDECETCRSAYEAERQVVARLEAMPHLAPSPLFAYKVMKQVHVFEPWHVAALDSVRRYIPQSRMGRVAAGAAASLGALSLTALTVLTILRFDTALFLFNMLLARVEGAALAVSASISSAFLGGGAAPTQTILAVLGALFLLSIIGTVFGLRAVATASRRRRS